MSVLLKQLILLLFLFFSFSLLSKFLTPDHFELLIDQAFGTIIVPCMSDPLRCAPECKRGPFPSAQATNRHRGGCAMWNAHVTAQALKRGYEEVSGEDEDPAITRQKRQKHKKPKNVLAKGSHPQSSIIAVNSTQVTVCPLSYNISLLQYSQAKYLGFFKCDNPRAIWGVKGFRGLFCQS